MKYDSHCHVNAVAKNSERLLIIPAINLSDDLEQVRLFTQTCKIGVGVHPWYVSSVELHNYKECLVARAISQRADFIGEVGLDKLKANYAMQLQVFEQSLQVAVELDLPVIIHCVRAYSDLMQLLTRYKVRGIVHAFNQNRYIANQLIEKGMCLGIGSSVARSGKLLTELAHLDISRLLVESDAPYMAADSYACEEYAKILAEKFSLDIQEYWDISYMRLNSLFESSGL